jgi:glycosyltransferase involved in cell wall biosynthesis
MKPSILIFHGYLLRGTGSNVYNANVVRVLVQQGHDVHLFSQEQYPETFDFVNKVVDYESGKMMVRLQREPRFPGRCTVYRPSIAGLLPVYVWDRYEGFVVRTFPELTDQELERYIALNVAAVRDVALVAKPDLALANHEIMGPYILHRALAGLLPYAVKIHASALEYVVRPYPRFLPYAREGILGAIAVLVGSAHVARRLLDTINEPGLASRIRLGPPGVDVHAFVPRDWQAKRAGLQQVVAYLDSVQRTGFDTGAANRLDALAHRGVPAWSEIVSIRQGYDPDGIDERALHDVAGLDPARDRIVAFIGKLIVSKGIDLLLCAWPLVLAREPRAKLLIVGFGAFREGLELLLRAIEQRNLSALRSIVAHGRALEGGAPDELSYVEAFFESLTDRERDEYFQVAGTIRPSLIFTGKLGHEVLVDLLPLADVLVVPSTFPEAFGMVAAEATACGVWPIVAHHSGLAEVIGELSNIVPAQRQRLLSFEVGPNAIRAIAERINTWLSLDADEQQHLRTIIREQTVNKWSWEGVAQTVLTACAGDLDLLPIVSL